MSFNIGSQQGNINNVAGDQTIHGGQHGQFAMTTDPRAMLDLLRSELDRLALPPEVASQVNTEVASLDAELASPSPDRTTMAQRLVQITRLVTAAGAAVTAGGTLAGALSSFAAWLGPIGDSVLHAIG
ncbi:MULTISPECIES: hypothetical protein [Streptomyces]|uniref:Uncharacterized protein n=1 Tax=Streptomyces doebereineriae TaxID=3075528 RepID=A0ABU2VBJ3_9ACTN|nr:hypothetical protein [Streptomyces sp. DSM 41640]MDT0482929.1 hypothetical protein [Streptomyces sp. DSM 41640]